MGARNEESGWLPITEIVNLQSIIGVSFIWPNNVKCVDLSQFFFFFNLKLSCSRPLDSAARGGLTTAPLPLQPPKLRHW